MTPAGRLAVTAPAVGLAAVAGAVAGQVFVGTSWVLPVLAAAAVPPALAAGTARARGRVLGLLAGTGALALLLALGVAPGRALVSGGRRLLTGALPLEATGGELAAVVLGTGVAGLAAVLTALTARRPTTAAVPGLLALGAALAVSASAGAPPAGLVVAAVGALAGVLLAGRWAERTPAPQPADVPAATAWAARGRAAAATAALLAVAAVVAASGAGLPLAQARGERTDARDLVDVPVVPRTSTSPLARFAGLAADGDRLLARVEGDVGGRLRLATLDRFDGTGWTSSAAAVRAGRTLPPGPADAPPETRRTVLVELLDAELFDFLLSPGRPVEVSVSGLGVVRSSGDLLVPAGRRPPQLYEVTGTEPDLRGAALPAARAARATPLQVPAPLAEQARRRTVGDSDFGRLAALERSLTEQGQRATEDPLPSGSGLFQVAELLRTGTGTAEQYASAFAVLAGSQGYDVRVVVGFRPAPRGQGADVVAGGVTAWPEVRFERLGWLPFAPTPESAGAGGAGSSAEEVVRRAVEEVARADAAAPPQVSPPAPVDRRGGAERTATPWPDVVTAVVGSLALLLLLGALGIPLLKARRRALRRSAAAPRGRVLGAWHDTVERLVESGHLSSPRGTTGDVVCGTAPRLVAQQGSQLGALAALADRAAWSGLPLSAQDADSAWSAADDLRTALRRSATRWRRPLRDVDPRPLTRSRRRPLPRT